MIRLRDRFILKSVYWPEIRINRVEAGVIQGVKCVEIQAIGTGRIVSLAGYTPLDRVIVNNKNRYKPYIYQIFKRHILFDETITGTIDLLFRV